MPGKHNTPFQMKGTPFQRNFGISPVKQDKRTGIMPEVKSKKVKSNMPEVKSKEVKSNMPTINPGINQRLEERKKKRAEELKKPKRAHGYTKTKVEKQLKRSRKKATTSEEKKYTYKEHEANIASNKAIDEQMLKYKKAYFNKHGSSSGGSDKEWADYQAGLKNLRSGYINR